MKDFLNQDLVVGDYVAMVYSCDSKQFRIGQIIKFTPKKDRLVEVGGHSWETVQDARHLIKLYPEQVTWWTLTRV